MSTKEQQEAKEQSSNSMLQFSKALLLGPLKDLLLQKEKQQESSSSTNDEIDDWNGVLDALQLAEDAIRQVDEHLQQRPAEDVMEEEQESKDSEKMMIPVMEQLLNVQQEQEDFHRRLLEAQLEYRSMATVEGVDLEEVLAVSTTKDPKEEAVMTSTRSSKPTPPTVLPKQRTLEELAKQELLSLIHI